MLFREIVGSSWLYQGLENLRWHPFLIVLVLHCPHPCKSPSSRFVEVCVKSWRSTSVDGHKRMSRNNGHDLMSLKSWIWCTLFIWVMGIRTVSIWWSGLGIAILVVSSISISHGVGLNRYTFIISTSLCLKIGTWIIIVRVLLPNDPTVYGKWHISKGDILVDDIGWKVIRHYVGEESCSVFDYGGELCNLTLEFIF